MEYYAGLDVAVEETAICVVDSAGEIVAETTVKTEPDAIAAALETYHCGLKRVGHEAGSLAPWLQHQLQAVGIPIICLETRHAHAALGAMRNKTDRNDPRGLAQIIRSRWFRAVHIKSDESYRLRLLLTHRRLLKRKFLDVENGLRHSLKAFGIKVGKVSRARFEARVRELVGDDPVLAGMADSLLRARAALWSEYLKMHNLLLRVVRNDALCRRFMRVPGVGPVTACAFRSIATRHSD